MSVSVHRVLSNLHLASMSDELRPAVPYGTITDAEVALAGTTIEWVGARAQAPRFDGAERVDCGGGWLTPGLIDCHTHLVYGGDRAGDFALRRAGHSYQEIAAQGGGILSTVRATREASADALFEAASVRLRALLREGVTSVEIKSGYGLTLESELKQLEVAGALGECFPVRVQRTFLGAHALPPEFSGRADDYIDHVCNEMLPAVARAGLADAVDVFCESVGFSLAQCRRVFECARALGLAVKGHVGQLSELGGAGLVAEFGGLSADHLEYLAPAGVSALARAKVVPVLLPGAYYFLGERQPPPVAALRAAGLPMAVASDANPGTSPMASVLVALNMACVLFGLSPEEALAGATVNAARALGVSSERGQVRPGYTADLALWDVAHPDQLSHGINLHAPERVWFGGRAAKGGRRV